MPLRRAGRVYESERELAIRHGHDTSYAVAIGRAAAIHVGRKARAAAIRAYRQGRNPRREVEVAFIELRELLLQGMVYARLRGAERAVRDVPAEPTRIVAARSPAYVRGIRLLRRRLNLTAAQLAALETQMDAHVLRVLATANESIQRELMKEIADIHRRGLHVREGIKQLRDKWRHLGLSEQNPFQLEGIFRTQTQMAYAAGNAHVYADPDIDEILWGYKYVTAGDDRVRPSHMALDGTTLPKSDPFWLKNKPPNGWACRCQLIPIFQRRREVRPPDRVRYEGKDVKVGADEGFEFDPGRVFSAA